MFSLKRVSTASSLCAPRQEALLPPGAGQCSSLRPCICCGAARARRKARLEHPATELKRLCFPQRLQSRARC